MWYNVLYHTSEQTILLSFVDHSSQMVLFNFTLTVPLVTTCLAFIKEEDA
jgi:hypothetical protein